MFTADIISCVEFNHDGELLATGDKAGRVVIFQRDQTVSCAFKTGFIAAEVHNFKSEVRWAHGF